MKQERAKSRLNVVDPMLFLRIRSLDLLKIFPQIQGSHMTLYFNGKLDEFFVCVTRKGKKKKEISAQPYLTVTKFEAVSTR